MGPNPPEYFTCAVKAKDARRLKLEGIQGHPAHEIFEKAVSIV
jgi:hypothetical protein